MEPSVWIAGSAGRKQAIHFGVPGRPLFGFFHPPREGSWTGAGAVLCAPFGTDQTRSDRAYRHLAERLSNAGFACLRFDPYGTGDSGGSERATHLVRGWVDDIGVAVQELRARSGAGAIALVGLRIGATLAAVAAAERGDIDAVALWSPCISGAAFVREVTKLHKLYMRIDPQLADTPPAPGDGEEALGTFLPRSVLDDLSAIDLLQSTRRPAPRTLVIDGGNLQDRDRFLARLTELGAGPELQSHPGHKFLLTISHRALLPEEIIDSVVRWLGQAFPCDLPPKAVDPRPSGVSPEGERPIVFGAAGRPLFGILTPATPSRKRAGRPPIIVTNAGCVNRSGAHRTTVEMARRWAQLGFDVLRVDLSGIGDSPAAPGAPENVTYPPRGLDDLDQAIQATGADRIILAGLCSGGDYAFQLGGRDPRVVGAWMLNPRTFCVLDLAAVESGDGAPPATSVSEVPRHLREMADGGVDALLVVSVGDPGVAYVDAHAGEQMRALSGVAGFRRVDIAGADHTFTPVTTQERVSDLLTQHLVGHYAGGSVE